MSSFDAIYKSLYREAFEYHKKYIEKQEINWDAAADELERLSNKYRHLPFASSLLSDIYTDLCSEPTDEIGPWEQMAI